MPVKVRRPPCLVSFSSFNIFSFKTTAILHNFQVFLLYIAGGESCSHVASFLWAIESGVGLRNPMTVTQKKAYWVMPSGVMMSLDYAPIKYISFCGKILLDFLE